MRKITSIILILLILLLLILCGCFSRVSTKSVSYDSLCDALTYYGLDLADVLPTDADNVTYTVERNLKGQSVECLEFMHDDSLYHLYFSVSLDVNGILNLAHTTE